MTDPAGTTLVRGLFPFNVGAGGITDGRAVPPFDPALGAGVALVGLGVAAVAFGLAGGRRAGAAFGASRLALVGGGMVGGITGTLMLAAGPR